jgi:ribonuclease M5
MIRIREAIIVEGKYDKNTLSQAVDALIIETGGFALFNNRERLDYIRRLAQARGIVVLTDPDGAGFIIRRYLKGAVDPARIKQAYIPTSRGGNGAKDRVAGGKAGGGGHDAGNPGGRPAPRRGDGGGRGRAPPQALHKGGALRRRPVRRRGQRRPAGGAFAGAGASRRLGASGLCEALSALVTRQAYEAALEKINNSPQGQLEEHHEV